ncbi:GGDEF domain-containing response regulator [Pseudobacteriovorax antillogorgiicola]|uniref:diguanylate cyclase n=1 Tax=Pseudobacteriovorax antillogorgiicola TaxID=1513793 RepID=A0A1Y6CDN7_9BACT|nr:diguanylate cyclase [Pseudobacteriovorax antillogorgiicola]TCS51758.1 response regulator receiver modulated diguanylate cyclase [Pseudobacteriovorax antillogorgiicola]SMF49747.1 response regulator receiver modulated diguanylate cyclase [Pseudobacteriovorax antillogorgiicola]
MTKEARHTVLVVEDSDVDAKILQKCLARAFDVIRCSTGEQALKMLKQQKIDVLVLDINLPGMSGIDVLRKVRSRARKDYLGVVVLTAGSESGTTELALSMGADGFGTKSDAVHHIVPLTHAALRVKAMTDELRDLNRKLRRANSRLTRLSNTDHLTGLYNMRYINQQLEQEFRRAKRYGTFFSVIMIDIDHFKTVNDDCDHLMGSFVISELGRQIRRVTRDVDFAGRYGGDEFIILLPETNAEGAHQVAMRLRDMVNHTIYDNGTNRKRITLSQGIHCFRPEIDRVNEGVQEALRSADAGLYEAKEGGRDRIVIIPSSKSVKKAS